MDAVVLRGRARRRHDLPPENEDWWHVLKKRPNLLAGEKIPPEPLQKRSIEKRERLKDAGLARFGERGFESTSIDDIAARANLAVGTFYQHYRSKRQLLLALMDELLEKLQETDFTPQPGSDVRSVVHGLLSRAFSHDLHYLGAYRAWQEAALTDADLARKQIQIHAWTTARITAVFERLQQLPGARKGVDIPGLACAMDSFFWSLLAQAFRMPRTDLDRWIDSSTHLIYHALFADVPQVKHQGR
jgi:AcrR family transcriptional regulator